MTVPQYHLPDGIYPGEPAPAPHTVILSDRRESKDLRISRYICAKIGA